MAVDSIALVGGRLIDGTGGEPVQGAAVVITGNRITAVGPEAEINFPRNTKKIDVQGKTILPGLIDSHVHIGGSGGGATDPREFTPTALENNLISYLKFGVTTVYDMAAHPSLGKMKSDLEQGSLIGPRMYGNGFGIAAPGSHPIRLLKELGVFDYLGPFYFQVETEEQGREAVRKIVDANTDGVKVFHSRAEAATSRYDCEQEKLSLDVLATIIKESHDHGKKVYAHISLPSEAREVVEAGGDVLVHSIGMAETGTDEVFKMMADRGTAYIPTLAVTEATYSMETGERFPLVSKEKVWPVIAASITNPKSIVVERHKIPGLSNDERRSLEISMANFRRALDAGVMIALGSDAGNAGMLHGATVIRELQLMTQAGMTTMQAIVAATRNAAVVIGHGENLGTVEKGKVADLIVVDGDPLSDVTALGDVELMVKDGQVIHPRSLKFKEVPLPSSS